MPEFKRDSAFVGDIEINGYSGDYIFETIKETGNFYEVSLLDKWTPYLNSPKTILDVGSNLGNHTLYWTNHLPDTSIFAFEPYEPNFLNLEENIKHNGLSDRIHLFKTAVGERKGNAKLKKFSADNFGGTTFQMARESSDETVEVISIDEFVENEKIEKIDFVKIDTEGFEVSVLKGAKQTLNSHRPSVWVEVSFSTHAEVVEILSAEKFVLVDIYGFNLLFIPEEKNVDNLHVSREYLLYNLLRYEEKATIYYQNYEIAKTWVETEKAKKDALLASNQELNEKLRLAQENYTTAKTWVETEKAKKDALFASNQVLNEKLQLAQENYATAKAWVEAEKAKNLKLSESLKESQDNYNEALACIEDERAKNDALGEELTQASDIIIRLLKQEEESAELIELLIQQNNKLQVTIANLKNENRIHQEKLNKITSVWYGRLGIKIYKVSKKFRNKIKSLIHRFQ